MNKNKIVFRFVSISFSVLIFLLIVIGLIKAGTYCYDFGYRIFTEGAVEAAPGRDVVVQITEDMSGLDIGGELEEKGLINDKLLFFVQLKLSAYADDINSGVYTLNTSMEPREMMEAMSLEKEDTETEEES